MTFNLHSCINSEVVRCNLNISKNIFLFISITFYILTWYQSMVHAPNPSDVCFFFSVFTTMNDSKNSGDYSLKKNESTPLTMNDFSLKRNLIMATESVEKSGVSYTTFTGNSDWIIDSGATDHMTCDRYRFSHISSTCSKTTITNANGVSSPVVGVGTVSLSPTLTIKDVLFVPSLILTFSLLIS